MLSNLLQKLHHALRSVEEHEEEIRGNWLNCARCGSNIESLINAIHVTMNEDIVFLCSETCYKRYMKSRMGQQIRLATRMVETMKKQEKPSALAST